MAKYPIITIPDRILRTKSTPFERVDDEVRQLIADMFETMYSAPGIGLAGVQIAVPKRVLVLDTAREETDEPAPLAMINPEIVWRGEKPSVHEEGCLSIPEIFAEVERPAEIKVTYLDEQGEQQERHCSDLLATVVQHEMDHLDGLLFVDHLSRLKRERLVRKFLKAQQAKGSIV